LTEGNSLTVFIYLKGEAPNIQGPVRIGGVVRIAAGRVKEPLLKGEAAKSAEKPFESTVNLEPSDLHQTNITLPSQVIR
jgi:hypothetical protein